jgi:[histone H3]-dimethyl-L-lysine9 demethylase
MFSGEDFELTCATHSELKDWPPSTDFKTAFPELYADFSQAVPIPNYVRRDGALNIASHFPSNTVAPDIGESHSGIHLCIYQIVVGPKMYNAMASFDGPGSKGSTRLHMDMADAINVMLYAAPTPDGRTGSAAWDLFRAEDSVKIRQFLRKKFKGQFQNDPIHCQLFYLDPLMRQELHHLYGVRSYRVYQHPGEAIFIPAGCAHQVNIYLL